MTFGYDKIKRQIKKYVTATTYNRRAVEVALKDGRINEQQREELLRLIPSDEGPKKIIYLTRHGETHWNKGNKVQTFTNTPDTYLTLNGQQDAKRKGLILREEKLQIQACYRSALDRTFQTARIIINQLGYKVRIFTSSRMNDVDLSYMDGMTPEEFKAKYPEIHAEREKDKFHFRLPAIGKKRQSESMYDALRRVHTLIYRAMRKYDVILFVGHRSINRVILYYLLHDSVYEVPSNQLKYVKITNEGIYRITTEGKKLSVEYNTGSGWVNRLLWSGAS